MKAKTLALIFLLVLCCILAPNTAINLPNNPSVLEVNNQKPKLEPRILIENDGESKNICQLCEIYASQAKNILNKTEILTVITHILEQSCSKLPSMTKQKQCIKFVDKFASLLLSKSIKFVDKFASLLLSKSFKLEEENICENKDQCKNTVRYGQQLSQKSCEVCQPVVKKAASTLKNPVAKMEILAILSLACSATEFGPQCNMLVTTFGPLILVSLQNFLENGNLCSRLRACASAPTSTPTSMPMPNPTPMPS